MARGVNERHLHHGRVIGGELPIEADIDPRNIGSARVLEKLGSRKDGYMPERWSVHGEMADTVNYGLLRRDGDER
ncbi:GNAT family N-acetyltransferase [Pyxidicoccus sp. 3LG]